MSCCSTCYTTYAFYGSVFFLPFAFKLFLWFAGSTISFFRGGARERLLHDKIATTGEDGIGRAKYRGTIGIFHPFAAGAGGGERVLWAIVADIQARYPSAVCILYSVSQVSEQYLADQALARFDIKLDPERFRIVSLPPIMGRLLQPATWAIFTLLLQSLASAFVAAYALAACPPDIFIETTGYSFAIATCKLMFPRVNTGAYVHYPTISNDMVKNLFELAKPEGEVVETNDHEGGQRVVDTRRSVPGGTSLGKIGRTVKGWYWQMFALLYGLASTHIDEVVANSSWTKDHLVRQWQPFRLGASSSGIQKLNSIFPNNYQQSDINTVFPPVSVDELKRTIAAPTEENESERLPYIAYVSQFRPEKRHALAIKALAEYYKLNNADPTKAPTGEELKGSIPRVSSPTLVLLGSTRDKKDEDFVDSLRRLARELGVADKVVFKINQEWSVLRDWLSKATIGINCMWNEHFGIGVVEYQAAGLIPVVDNSGGPAKDIVCDTSPAELQQDSRLEISEEEIHGLDSGPTGLLAVTVEEYARQIDAVFKMSPAERVAIRRRARIRSSLFSEKQFTLGWKPVLDRLVDGGLP